MMISVKTSMAAVTLCLISLSSNVWAEPSSSFTQDVPSFIPLFNSPAEDPGTVWGPFIAKLPNSKFVQWGLDWTGISPYAENADQFFSPASVEKTVTTATAMRVLGGDFRFENSFQGQVDLIAQTLTAPEFVVSGDPTWAHPEYEALTTRVQKIVDALVSKNIKKVVGTIKVTSTRPFLQTYERPMEWKPSWLLECYATLSSPVILNGNCASFKIVSKTSAVWTTSGVATPLVVKLTSAKVDEMPTNALIEPEMDDAGRVIQYTISGKMPTVLSYSVPVQNNEDWLRNLFFAALKKANIEYDATPVTASRAGFAAHESFFVDLSSITLREMLPRLLQDSINLIADRLFLEIAYHLNSAHPSDAEIETLTQVAGDMKYATGIKILDGSGLIAADQLSPQALLAFLGGLVKQAYFQDFFVALPVAGVSGTLAGRLTGPVTKGKIFAKTGTLDGVANLAGYYRKANQSLEPFIILTHSNLEGDTVRGLMDRVVVEFAQQNAP